jgi:3-hydroxyacyl-[acyl-carrier-protein] dehydratase
MLEVMAASAGWLARVSEEFRHSMFLLKTARNVTYKSFVTPGRTLRVEVRSRRIAEDESEFDGAGFCDEAEMVKARFTLRHFNLADRNEAYAEMDKRLTRDARSLWMQLRAD